MLQVERLLVKMSQSNPFEEYRITSPFGWRTHPISGKREFHTGIDLVKAHQAPIYAFVGGKVIHAMEGVRGSGFGNYGVVVAILDEKTGHLHVYAHLDCVLVVVCQMVERGKMIGRQGNTGQSTGSHLHYEIRKTSSPSFGWIADREDNCFEPTKYLQDYYARKEEKAVEPQIADWKQTIMDAAAKQGLIEADKHEPDEPASKWFVLATTLNAMEKITGKDMYK